MNCVFLTAVCRISCNVHVYYASSVLYDFGCINMIIILKVFEYGLPLAACIGGHVCEKDYFTTFKVNFATFFFGL